MKVKEIYRVSSHKNIVEVDDVSISGTKVSNQVLIIEDPVTAPSAIIKEFELLPLGLVLRVDKFTKDHIDTFDYIVSDESRLRVIKRIDYFGKPGIICVPEAYTTFVADQILLYEAKTFLVKLITLSDRAHRGIYEDTSGPRIISLLKEHFAAFQKRLEIDYVIIPDQKEELELHLEQCKHDACDILLTTGGTGIGPKDLTVDTIRPYLDKEIPGIMEMIRVKYGSTNPKALLSRSIAGLMQQTLVFTLPGSEKAVQEYMAEILPLLNHMIYMIYNIDKHPSH